MSRLIVSALLLSAGCGHRVATVADTGARGATQSFFNAIIQQDWQAAYASLAPHLRAQLSQADFASYATTYRANLGFEPETIAVRACDEHGDNATAHVEFIGRGTARQVRFKDALTLKKEGSTWGVVPSASFYRQRGR